MSIQFLDMRLSQDSASDSPGLDLNASLSPYTFGNIGLQTAGIAPENVGLVRVTLNAFTQLAAAGPDGPYTSDVTFQIYRNDTLIFTTVYPGYGASTDTNYEMAGITAVDFPPAAAVLGGQIQYTITASTTRYATLGARSFSGIAVAGNS